jgi:hypothetical protein
VSAGEEEKTRARPPGGGGGGGGGAASHFHARELTSHATETLSTLVSPVVLRAPSPPSRRDSEPDARARRERVGRQP